MGELSERGDVVFLSHTHWLSDFVVGSHHLARELSRDGWRVARVVTPLSPAHTVLKRGDPGNSLLRWLRGDQAFEDAHRVLNVRPATALPAQYGGGRFGPRILRRLGIDSPRFVFIDQPLMLSQWVFDLGATVIYRPTDLHLGRDATRLVRQWLPRVDGVAATSGPVLEHLAVPPGLPTTVLRNGVQLRPFSSVDEPWAERAGVVYVGSLDHRFDWAALQEIGELCPHVRFTIAGPTDCAPRLPKNVRLAGAVPYRDVPTLLAQHRVALMPFSAAVENRGRSPMKLYECIAAGLHVLVSDHLGEVPSELGGLCRVYSSPAEAASLIESLSLMPPSPGSIERAVSGQDWSAKAGELTEFARKVESGRRT